MVSSVEIYEPRRGTWIEGEAMKEARGYSAAAVVKDCIYVIGGYEGEGVDILDTVLFVTCLFEMTKLIIIYPLYKLLMVCVCVCVFDYRLSVTRMAKGGKRCRVHPWGGVAFYPQWLCKVKKPSSCFVSMAKSLLWR